MACSLRPRNLDFNKYWDENCHHQLQALLVMNSPDSSNQVKPSAIQLYTNIYELCVSHPESHVLTLLQHITALFFQYSVKLRKEIMRISDFRNHPRELVQKYSELWELYCTSMRSMSAVCRYLNKSLRASFQTAQLPAEPTPEDPSIRRLPVHSVSVRLSREDAGTFTPSSDGSIDRLDLLVTGVQDLARKVWNKSIIQYFRTCQGDALIEAICSCVLISTEAVAERPSSLKWLKSAIESFQICADSSLLVKMETIVLSHYAQESANFLSQNPTSLYISWAASKLSNEASRLQLLWSNPQESAILLRQCQKQIVEVHQTALLAEFNAEVRKSPQDPQYKQLALLFDLIENTSPSLLENLRSALKSLIIEEAISITVSNQASTLAPLLVLHQKYQFLIENDFHGSKVMSEALSSAFKQIINEGTLPQSWHQFAVFFDESITGQVTTALMGEMVKNLLSLLKDFDAFLDEYRSRMGRRLLFSLSNLEIEEFVVQCLKDESLLSSEQGCHLSRMLNDVTSTNDNLVPKPSSMTTTILTSHSWPEQFNPISPKEADFTMFCPAAISESLASFESEFRDRNPSRKLQWCPHLFTVECGEDNLKMTLRQFQILQILPVANVNEIAHKLNISLGEVAWNVEPLLKSGLVVADCEKIEVSLVKRGESFKNIDLLPTKAAMMTSTTVLGELSSHSAATHQQEEDPVLRRSVLLQSSIVSVLKRKSRVSPAELLKLTAAMAMRLANGHAFVPKADEFNVVAEILIGKGFIEFSRADNLYIYLP